VVVEFMDKCKLCLFNWGLLLPNLSCIRMASRGI